MRLGEVIDTLKGYAFKSKWFQQSGRPIVKVRDFSDDSVSIDKINFVSEDIAVQFEQYSLKSNDVVVQTVGSWPSNPDSVVGKAIKIPKILDGALLNQNAVIINPNSSIIRSFLFYLLRANHFKSYIIGTAQGAASQASITLDSIKNYNFVLPDILTQKIIASILSAYDNLIDNNTRRIQILEEIAQRIYKEWFVDFKYPGYENDKMVNSELGMIPEGWEVKKTAEVFEILGGGTPSKKISEYWNPGTINWYSPTDLTKSNSMFALESNNRISDMGLQKSSAKLFPAFSVMLTSRATIGVIAINTTEACTNQGFITCVPSEHFSTYQIFYWLFSNIKMFLAHSSGATFKELTKTTFKKFDLVVPPKNTSSSFNELVTPIASEILTLQKQNENLRQTRDLLLPKLISGKIEVSDLDIDTSILDD